MDIGLHHVAKCGVNGAMSGQLTQPGERPADHPDVEMATPVTRPGMPRMTVAIIFYLQLHGGQRMLQRITNSLDPLRIAHGSTLRNGRTSVRAYTPAAT